MIAVNWQISAAPNCRSGIPGTGEMLRPSAASLSRRVLTTQSPLRTRAAQREEIRQTFERARRDAYPLGLDPDR